MRFISPSSLFLLLPTLLSIASASAADDAQAVVKDKASGWLDKAKAYVSSAVPEVPNPIDAGASKVAELKVEKINIRNYERKLGPKPDGEEEWMIFITGGNKSCHGRCGKSDLAWNQSVAILSALPPYSGSTLKLATLNCEVEIVLCTAWAAAVPSIFHFIFPQQPATIGAATPLSPMRDIHLNISYVETKDIASIPRVSKSRYLDYEPYEGAWHPVDGTLRKFQLLNPVGYVLWGFGSTPSWLLMIAISFFSRQMMARRATSRPGGLGAVPGGAAPPAAGAGAARPAAGVGTGASPAGAKGAAKRRK